MKRIVLTLPMVAGVAGLAGSAWAQAPPDLSGKWTLNSQLSSGPSEIGFGIDWAATDANGRPINPNTGGGTSGGGGRRRGGGGSGGSGGRFGGAQPFPLPVESEKDAKRLQQLTTEARNPSSHLVIVDTPAAVTITNDQGVSRTFHPTGKDEVFPLADGVDVAVTTRRDGDKLVVLYQVEESRLLRYTYSRSASPAQLIVDVQFVGRGGGDEVKRVYEPSKPGESMTAPAGTAAAAGAPPPGSTPAGMPASGQAQQPFNQQPDAELKGLNKLGVVVEGLSEQAAKCGLKQDQLETSVARHLTDAGFKVARNSDEDSYVYVNVMTASLSNGYCVSRYDASVFTHATTTMSYGSERVLVEVQLLHKGGIAGGQPAEHADGVVRGVLDYVDGFITRIREANKQAPAAPPQSR